MSSVAPGVCLPQEPPPDHHFRCAWRPSLAASPAWLEARPGWREGGPRERQAVALLAEERARRIPHYHPEARAACAYLYWIQVARAVGGEGLRWMRGGQ